MRSRATGWSSSESDNHPNTLEIRWWIDSSTPPQVEEALMASGGLLCDTYALIACELGTESVSSRRPGDVHVEVVANRRTFDDAMRIEVDGWNRPIPDAAVLDGQFERTMRELEAGTAWAVVAYVEGVPASMGWAGMHDDIVRIIGGVTIPLLGGRGAYGAVVDARVRLGRDHGASLALTRARPTTSGPILKRRGFEQYSLERCFELTLGGC